MGAEPQQNEVEVLLPCSKAYDHMVGGLFPFSFERWLTLAFIAFLTTPLMLATWTPNPGASFRHRGWAPNYSAGEAVSVAAQFIEGHAAAVAVCLILGLAIYLVLEYISSRAIYVYMDCVARRTVAFVAPWKRGRAFAYSFFLGRVVIDLVGGGALALICLTALVSGWASIRQGILGPELLGILLFAALFAVPVLILLLLTRWVYTNLVASIMYVNGIGALAAWGELFRLMKGRWLEFFLYAVMNVGLCIAYGILSIPATCCTCCLAAVPVLHQLVMQPLLFWFRAYPFYFLAQFGAPYAFVVSPAPPEAPVSPAPSVAPQPPQPPAAPTTDQAPATASAPVPVEPTPVTAQPTPERRVANCTHCGQPHQVLGGPGAYICSRCGGRFEVR